MEVTRPKGRDYVTYRDAEKYRDTAEQWDAIKARAVVDRETVRDRMRRGWALEPALTTPKEWRRSVAGRIRLLVQQTPGITAAALAAAMPDVSRAVVYRTVGRDVDAGRIRTAKVPGHNAHGWGQVLGYTMVPEPERPVVGRGRPHTDDAWTPGAWIHPIRRRALGLPPVTQRDDVVPLDFSDPRRAA